MESLDTSSNSAAAFIRSYYDYVVYGPFKWADVYGLKKYGALWTSTERHLLHLKDAALIANDKIFHMIQNVSCCTIVI